MVVVVGYEVGDYDGGCVGGVDVDVVEFVVVG